MGTQLPTERGTAAPPHTFAIYRRRLYLRPYKTRSVSIVAKRLDGSGISGYLVRRDIGIGPADILLHGDTVPSHGKRHRSPQLFGAMSKLVEQGFGFCAVVNYMYNLSSCACCTDGGRPASVNRDPCLLWRHGRPSQLLLSTCYI